MNLKVNFCKYNMHVVTINICEQRLFKLKVVIIPLSIVTLDKAINILITY